VLRCLTKVARFRAIGQHEFLASNAQSAVGPLRAKGNDIQADFIWFKEKYNIIDLLIVSAIIFQ
jgi:hypothetical protein